MQFSCGLQVLNQGKAHVLKTQMGEAFEKGLGVFALALPGVGDFARTEQGVGHFSWGLVLAVEDVVHGVGEEWCSIV